MNERDHQSDEDPRIVFLEAWKSTRPKQHPQEVSRSVPSSPMVDWEDLALRIADGFPTSRWYVRESEESGKLLKAIATVARYEHFLELQQQLEMFDEQALEKYKVEFKEESLEDLAYRLNEVTPQMAREQDTYLFALSKAFEAKYFLAMEQLREADDIDL